MKSSALFSVSIFRALRSPGCRAVLAAWLFIALLLQSATAVAPGPAWWSAQNVLDPYSVADDFAAANAGQLKYMAAKAAAAMEEELPGGAGSTINTMVAGWSLAPASGVTRDNYLAINQGQLKHVATPFYDRLGLQYPWAGGSGLKDNYKLVNLGQLKNVFSFALNFRTVGQGAVQIPTATLAAALAQWQALPVRPAGSSTDDFDGDGIPNLQEYLMGTPLFDPLDIDGDGILDSIENAHPGVLSKLRFADAVADHDSDGVMNFEELILGLNLSSATTSGRADGMSDAKVLAWGLAARKPLVSSAVAGTDALKTFWGQIDAAWITANVGNDYLNWLDTTVVSGVAVGLSAFRTDVLNNWVWQPWNPGEGSIENPGLAYDANWNPIDMDGDGVNDFDRDNDNLPDLWEYRYSLNLRDSQDAANDPDGDTLTNLQEYQAGTNPRLADSDGDGFADGIELAQLAQGADPLNGAVGMPLVLVLASGNFQTVTAGGGSAPLVVQVTQGGLPVRGAQVQFTVGTGSGGLRAADAAAATGTPVSLTTDANGTASAVYLAEADTGTAGVTATLGSGGGSSSVNFALTIAEAVVTYTYGSSDSGPSVGAPSGNGNSNPGPVADPTLMADSKSMYAIWEKWTDAASKSFFKSYGNIRHLWDTGLGTLFFDKSTDQTAEIVKRFNAERWRFYANPTDGSGFLWAPTASYEHSYSNTTDGPWYQPTQEIERQVRRVTALKVVTYVPQKEPPEMTFLVRVYLGDSGWAPLSSDSPQGTLQTSGVIHVKGSASKWSSSLDAYCTLKDGAVIVDPGPEGAELIAKTDNKYIQVVFEQLDLLKQENMPNFGVSNNTTDMASTYSTAKISGGGVAYITGQPTMPQLKALYPGLAANINVQWKLEIKTELTKRGTKDDKKYPASGYKTLPGNQEWDIGAEFGTDFVGGKCKLFYKVDGGAEQTHEFFIRGKNPQDATAKAHVQQTQGNYRFAWAIVQQESRQGNRCFNQFNSGGNGPGSLELPNYGAPDGWGISQLDEPLGVSASTTEVYEWKANVTKLYAELQEKEQMALSYFNAIKSVYPNQWEEPPNQANSAQGFPSVSTNMTPLEAAVVQLYNGGAVLIRVKNKKIVPSGGSAYVSCWKFHPNNASGQKWEFVPNQNNYVYKVLHDEYEGNQTVTE